MGKMGRLPASVIALALACAISILVAVAMTVVVITTNNETADTNKELLRQLAILTTQNRGPRGDDGLSAYEIWLSLGNTGTEEDFIESLRGERGSDGLNGQDGASGKNGSNGASVAAPVCTGTSLEWYLTTGAHIGTTPLICIK